MERKLITTSDGSHTFLIENWKETYHSKFGAIGEAYYVFVDRGFYACDGAVSILEIGMGTGLNAFITYLEAEKSQKKVNYEAIEAFPISIEESQRLNYVNQLEVEHHRYIFDFFHKSPWDELFKVSKYFNFKKRLQRFQDITDRDRFDVIYYDAFGADVQPNLWTEDMFKKMFLALRPGGILVTYASRITIRMAMKEVGFEVEKLFGPPGKREMLRATRPKE